MPRKDQGKKEYTALTGGLTSSKQQKALYFSYPLSQSSSERNLALLTGASFLEGMSDLSCSLNPGEPTAAGLRGVLSRFGQVPNDIFHQEGETSLKNINHTLPSQKQARQ